MTVTPIVIDMVGTITKRLVKGLEDLEIGRRAETNQTTVLRSATILRRVCGVSTEGQGQRAKLCCCLISDSIFWLFYFTPTLASRCNALPKKVPKIIIHKKTITDRKRRRFFYTFLYLLGSTTIPWAREFSLNAIEMVESPS